jgi:hypothetical protein
LSARPASALVAKLKLWLWGVRAILRYGRPRIAIAFLGGLGDELLCTAPLFEWQRRHVRRVWFRTRQPTLFKGLPSSPRILPDDPRYERLAALLGSQFRYLSYSRYETARDRDEPTSRHIIAEICARSGLTGRVALRPYWCVSQAEYAAAAPWRDCIVIQTSTLVAHVPMPNKQWPSERFQAVVDGFPPGLRFVQIGSRDDPPLHGVTDLRGNTSLRESAAILRSARAFVGLVGFLMHLARAVDCPAVIVYGGRETPALTGYPCNLNLTATPPCSPCWQRSLCDHARVCMNEISADAVIAALKKMLASPRGALAVEEVSL